MKELACEEVLMVKMAEADGEGASSPEANLHIESCQSCRKELAAMRGLNEVFREHSLIVADVNVWPQVRESIARRSSGLSWLAIAVLIAVMAGVKIVSMSMTSDLAFLFGLLPLACAAALFLLLNENPFKVNTKLILESDHG